jgi:hypothetical protein
MTIVRIVLRRVVIVAVRAQCGRGFGRDQEAAAGQDMILMLDEAAFGQRAEIERTHRALNVRPKFRKGVEESCGEHIARPASQRIQMKMQKRLAALCRKQDGPNAVLLQ